MRVGEGQDKRLSIRDSSALASLFGRLRLWRIHLRLMRVHVSGAKKFLA